MPRAKSAPAELRSMLLVRRNDADARSRSRPSACGRSKLRIAQIETRGAAVPRRRRGARRAGAPAAVAATRGALVRRGARADRPVARTVRLVPPGTVRGQLVAVAHSQDFELDQIDVEFGVTLEDGDSPILPPDSPLSVRELPRSTRWRSASASGCPRSASGHGEDRPFRRGRRRDAGGPEPRGVPSAAAPRPHARGGRGDAVSAASGISLRWSGGTVIFVA